MTLRHLIALLLGLSPLTTSLTHAQDYRTALGLRVGAPHSISLKHFFNPAAAVEVFAGYRYWAKRDSWFAITGLYEHHFPIEGARGLKWYVGGGASIIFWDYLDNPPVGYAYTSLSLLGVLGLDFKFPNAPFNISVDWVPIVYFGYVRYRFGAGYGAIGLRYTF